MARITTCYAALAVLVLSGVLVAGCSSSRLAPERSYNQLAAVPLAGDAGEPVVLAADLRATVADRSEGDDVVVPPRLFDRYVVATSPSQVDSSLLWPAFRQMLGSAGVYTDDTSRAHLHRHLALSELLYADEIDRRADFEQRAQQALEWWLMEQPAPASEEHERLATHLARWTDALKKYPSRASATGVDARGETLIRYGAPSRIRGVDFSDADLLRSFFRDGLPIRLQDFPSNEVWIYDHLGRSGVFLFVEGPAGQGYGHGSVNDLMPRQLRNRGVTGSARGDAYAGAALRTLGFVFSQLALAHNTYSSRFDAISNHVNWHTERATGARLGGRAHGAVAGFDAASRTLENALLRNDREDRNLVARRSASMPAEYALVDRARVPVGMRVVRRLDSDYGTSLHLYWQLDGDSYRSCIMETGEVPDRSRLRLVAFAADHQTQTTVADRSAAEAPWGGINRETIRLAKSLDDLALQFDGLGEFTSSCSGVVRSGSLQVLDIHRHGVEVSDLLPFALEDLLATRERLGTERFSDADFDPIIADALHDEEGMGIYFEVYTETDLDDAYILEYEINKTMPGGILRRTQTSQSIYQARQTAIDQRLSAAFLIDRAEWSGARSIEILVRVTNLETGGSSERTLALQVAEDQR